jgi:hypothetical protein
MKAVSNIPVSGDNAYEAVMSEAWLVFLQSGYRALWTIRVSRYKVAKQLRMSPGIVILLTAVARFGFVKHYKSVLVAGTPACRQAGIGKNVTNNLPLSVLWLVLFI